MVIKSLTWRQCAAASRSGSGTKNSGRGLTAVGAGRGKSADHAGCGKRSRNHYADILRALRQKTRLELFAGLNTTRTLGEAVQGYLNFALHNPHGYEVLFDGVGKPPSLYEPWPSFNLMRRRLAERLGGTPRQHNRLMLGIWSLMHGTAMLIIRGGFEGSLRTQAVHACVDTVETIVRAAARKSAVQSGPKWPASLVLGEAERSSVGNGDTPRRNAKITKGRR